MYVERRKWGKILLNPLKNAGKCVIIYFGFYYCEVQKAKTKLSIVGTIYDRKVLSKEQIMKGAGNSRKQALSEAERSGAEATLG